ncbi:MAG: MFS transporter [Verrucomicrobiae bacterium]|nr:MFS transporter [Verrucomicrobiae bacterium]
MRQLLEFARKNRKGLVVLGVMSGSYFFAFFHRVAVPGTIFDEIQTDLKLTAGQVALLGAIYLYIYGGMQVFVGMMADHFGGARVFLAGAVLMNIGGVVFPLSHSLWLLYAARGLVGLGCSLIFISVVKMVDELFHEQDFAPVLGAAIFVGYAGGLVGTFPLERLVNGLGWRTALGVLSGVSVVLLAAAVVLLRGSGLFRRPADSFNLGPLKAVLTNWRAAPVMVSGAITFSLYFLIQANIGKKLLSDCFHLTSAKAAGLTFAMMLICMCGVFGAGLLTRFLGNRRRPILVCATILTLLASMAMLIGLSAGMNDRVAQWACLFFALSAASNIVFCAAMRDLSSDEAMGTSIGLFNGVCYVGIAALVTVAGGVMDLFRNETVATAAAVIYPMAAYRGIFVICVILAVISLAVSFFIHDRADHLTRVTPEEGGQ